MSQAKKCVKCKYTFIANEGWESTCIVCWKESKEIDLLKNYPKSSAVVGGSGAYTAGEYFED